MYRKISKLTYGKKYQNLCRLPYHNHPKGCPNYGKREDCPPCDLVGNRFDLNNDIYVVYTEYPVGEFAERMRLNHPEWKDQPRQWYNCIRWQGTARKKHKKDILEFQKEFPNLVVDSNPEALGIDVTELMREAGIELEWNYYENHDKNRLTYRVSIAGILKEHKIEKIGDVEGVGVYHDNNNDGEFLIGHKGGDGVSFIVGNSINLGDYKKVLKRYGIPQHRQE